jgi:hypothetical protein
MSGGFVEGQGDDLSLAAITTLHLGLSGRDWFAR